MGQFQIIHWNKRDKTAFFARIAQTPGFYPMKAKRACEDRWTSPPGSTFYFLKGRRFGKKRPNRLRLKRVEGEQAISWPTQIGTIGASFVNYSIWGGRKAARCDIVGRECGESQGMEMDSKYEQQGGKSHRGKRL